ncbi:unnamed protein product [Prorocentrum cordatum]|uniref:ABCA1-4-like C-terminal R2 regulatory domain-containing protein n=1 Tax=Prorocentrum cordatum TaxID=2364126 RepID=A0ABN9SQ02_9DINO|nr:unnamed protein product [Polarella glacialis]
MLRSCPSGAAAYTAREPTPDFCWYTLSPFFSRWAVVVAFWVQVYELLAREGAVPSGVFSEWWLLESRFGALGAFLEDRFPGTAALEQHERTVRYRLPAGSTLAKIFRNLEASQRELALEEYGICQTSLEQIFNDFAARQQEETGAVRGLFASGHAAVTAQLGGSALEVDSASRVAGEA